MEMINLVIKKIYNNPSLIAEIGVNHESDSNCKNLCLEAKESSHAAKFQTYKAENIASKEAKAYWDLNENSITSQKELKNMTFPKNIF